MGRQTLTPAALSNGAGLLANMPANGSVPDGSTYFATDQNGGTPYRMVSGAWVQEAAGVFQFGGGELARITFATASETHTQQADVTGMTITFTVGSRPVDVEAWVPTASNSTAGQEVLLQISDTSNVEKGRGLESASVASKGLSIRATERISAAGTYTRKMRIGNNQGSGGGTVTIFGTATAAGIVPYLSAIER